MYFHYINKLIHIPEVDVKNLSFDDDQAVVYLRVAPVQSIQNCPYCGSRRVNRDGILYHHHVRHLPLMNWRTILLVPAVNMKCKQCDGHFVWQYEFVKPKKRYTQAFQNQLIEQGQGTTVQAMSGFQNVPYTTAERYFKNGLQTEREYTQATCIRDAINRDQLVLGIDDFAVRKGHTYNTGIHDLKGGNMLDIISGRTTEDLRNFQESSSYIHALNPVAVVMDLSYTYHKFVKESFPQAIRIADRFHVNRYVTDAMHEVRKEVQKNLSTHARKQLKRHHRLLEIRYDDLSAEDQAIVQTIVNYDDRLKAVYNWKEAFIDWYDLSANAKQAELTLKQWYQQGHRISHKAVESCIKTIQNWETEIINYHRLRFTNAVVEGRHNKIKALQRRHFFTRNRNVYENRILVECNWAYMQGIA
ncbi:ISL3 family transposase [Mammaliicoccus lentus]|uniref:ISL3 family transposase n=1 Tax=Mammaliicoccus lentus TaxID=42858 RepID=A0AAX3W340_MAMLE|nr:ISL3 family transposase [Mammaliicoccus lentus]WHI59802.1 ISL3 family transposase [Mammaliicoccus lentus]